MVMCTVAGKISQQPCDMLTCFCSWRTARPEWDSSQMLSQVQYKMFTWIWCY